MARRPLPSLFALMLVLLAVTASMAQHVAVASTHVQHEAHGATALLDHGHVHDADLPKHDTADHAHDVAQDVAPTQVPNVGWAASWTRGSAR